MIPTYPRTYHIGDSRMDPGMQNPEGFPFSHLIGKYLVIEEKVDGCQVGVFFDENMDIRCFTRNTYITGHFPRQKHLNMFLRWCQDRQDALYDVLENRYVLYFEWAYAVHTIYYDSLPSYALECDLFDRQTGKFVSTERRLKILSGLALDHVHVLTTLKYDGKYDLKGLMCPSHYISSNAKDSLLPTPMRSTDKDMIADILKYLVMDSIPEGLYIKVEDDQHVLERFKWIRKVFVDTILKSKSHWIDRLLIPNGLKHD